MPLVKYIEADGREFEVDVAAGNTLMQGAMDNMIDGILAECGGAGACATCHCYVDEGWLEKTGEANDTEKELLEAVMDQRETSRLSCQITVTEAMDGLVVHLPESQY